MFSKTSKFLLPIKNLGSKSQNPRAFACKLVILPLILSPDYTFTDQIRDKCVLF